MSQPKFNNQPLGAIKDLDNIIESFSTEQLPEQTRNLTIIYAKRKLQVQIPVHWTVNKLKCMMLIHFETLNFDKFQFQCNKFLIPGKTTVAQLPSQELIVTQAECPNAFQNYYKQNMKKVVKKYKITTQNSLYPITHRSLSLAMIENIPKQRLNNIQQIPENRRREQPQGMMVMNILRILGIAFMSNLIFTFASFGQIAVLVGVAVVYYMIDEYVKYNDRRRREQQRRAQQEQANRKKQQANRPNENQNVNIQRPQQTQEKLKKTLQELSPQKQFVEQLQQMNQQDSQIRQNATINDENLESMQNKKPQRKIFKAKLIFWIAFLSQFFYCYILSIFPNWTVETHLHANEGKLNKIMDKIKRLDPQASEMIKKWQIKQNKSDQKGNNQDPKMKKQ